MFKSKIEELFSQYPTQHGGINNLDIILESLNKINIGEEVTGLVEDPKNIPRVACFAFKKKFNLDPFADKPGWKKLFPIELLLSREEINRVGFCMEVPNMLDKNITMWGMTAIDKNDYILFTQDGDIDWKPNLIYNSVGMLKDLFKI